MSVEDPVVITCAISGVLANREQCPAIPYTPAEYAAEARRIVDEGGVMIHIHARKPDGSPSFEVEDYRAITEAIRAEVGEAAIINHSTGAVGVSVEKRVEYLRACRPEVAALNMGSMNYAKYSRSRKGFVFNMVFANPFDEIIELLRAMNELGIKPEHECFDVGHVGSLAPLIDMGVLHPPLHVDCVMGVVGGIPPSARNLAAMVDNVPDGASSAARSGADSGIAGGPAAATKSHWGVIGISREQWLLVAAALTLGGSIRVGLEDNLYLPDGQMARSNGELIAKARQMAEEVGRRPATVGEARELLNVRANARAGSATS
jgi:3-keto-5-aminohexanoate cleavage enzyme